MVKMEACGVCHSDLSTAKGVIALPPPVVLGHEGAGRIVSVGEGVKGLAVGDRVSYTGFTEARERVTVAAGQAAQVALALDVAASELWDDEAPRSTPWDPPTTAPGRYVFKKSGDTARSSAKRSV